MSHHFSPINIAANIMVLNSTRAVTTHANHIRIHTVLMEYIRFEDAVLSVALVEGWWIGKWITYVPTYFFWRQAGPRQIPT